MRSNLPILVTFAEAGTFWSQHANFHLLLVSLGEEMTGAEAFFFFLRLWVWVPQNGG
jgi:hypothetical protein